MALLVQSQADFDQQLADAGDKPVVVGFTQMTQANFAAMYSQVVAECPHKSAMVFLLVMVDFGPAGKEIADNSGAGDPPTFLFYLNKQQVTTFSDAEAQKVVDCLQEKLSAL